MFKSYKAMTENYVTFQIAELLKGLGFDAQCRAFYKKWNGIITLFDCDKSQMLDYCNNTTLAVYTDDEGELNIAAPTVQMANKFLRERYNIFIQVELYSKNGDFTYEIFKNTKRMDIKRKVFPTPEEANLDALLVCLTNLI